MAVLIVDHIDDVDDVVELMNYLARCLAAGSVEHLTEAGKFTLTKGPGPTPGQLADMVCLGYDEECWDDLHRPECRCLWEAANTDPRQDRLAEAARVEGPVPYVPCPERGDHAWLADCWACWSDVHRGAISLDMALSGQGVGR